MIFDHLILRKIFKFVATRCQILKLKCTKFVFGGGSAPEPTGGAYSAPRPSSWIEAGLLLREGRKMGGEWEDERGKDIRE